MIGISIVVLIITSVIMMNHYVSSRNRKLIENGVWTSAEIYRVGVSHYSYKYWVDEEVYESSKRSSSGRIKEGEIFKVYYDVDDPNTHVPALSERLN